MFETDLPPSRLATLGFVAGLSLDAALARCCGSDVPAAGEGGLARRLGFALKWPNDVLAGHAKLAGILLGTEGAASGRRTVVIGIGVNVMHAPKDLAYPAVSLRELGWAVDAETLFSALSEAWVETHALWADGAGFGAVRRAWLARAAGVGGAVAVKTAEGVARGVFETIDEHGQLVIRTPEGSARTVSAGEVHFGAAATARGLGS